MPSSTRFASSFYRDHRVDIAVRPAVRNRPPSCAATVRRRQPSPTTTFFCQRHVSWHQRRKWRPRRWCAGCGRKPTIRAGMATLPWYHAAGWVGSEQLLSKRCAMSTSSASSALGIGIALTTRATASWAAAGASPPPKPRAKGCPADCRSSVLTRRAARCSHSRRKRRQEAALRASSRHPSRISETMAWRRTLWCRRQR